MPKKWDQDGTPSGKVLELFTTLLFNNRAFSLKDLTSENRLNMSKASVLRLIKQLERSRVCNIQREQRGREAFFRLERSAPIPISFNAEGLAQLALCREFLTNFLPEAMHKDIQASLDQMAAHLPHDCLDITSGIGSTISKGRIDYTPFQAMIATLIQAIRENRVCVVRYRAALGGKEKEYDFAPKRLLAYRESLYAEGWRVTDKGAVEILHESSLRLAVHRLKECVLTRRTSEKLPDVPPPSTEGFGIMKGEPFTVAVRFDASAATYVAERRWSDVQRVEQHADGSITLHTQMFNVPECIAWILSFGKTAEVLEPDWLRRDIKETISVMQGKYDSANEA